MNLIICIVLAPLLASPACAGATETWPEPLTAAVAEHDPPDDDDDGWRDHDDDDDDGDDDDDWMDDDEGQDGDRTPPPPTWHRRDDAARRERDRAATWDRDPGPARRSDDPPPPPRPVRRDFVSIAASQPSSDPVRLDAALSHEFFDRSSPDRLIARIHLAGVSGARPARPPLNLALVIDRSGSMAEEDKFMHAAQAARLVVENLSDRDVFSLVAFNQASIVLSPAGRAVNKEFLAHRLTEIDPQGWTNLSAGLLEGFAQIDSQARTDDQVRQVIVLTDGLANRGVTNPGELRKLVEAARRRDIRVSTMGCGTEFDESVLKSLAEAGGGRYTFVRSSEAIPGAMAAELGGLLEVAAQNVKLDVNVGGGSAISRIYSRLLERPAASYSFTLGDFRQGEQGVFLLELTRPKGDPGAAATTRMSLTLDDPRTSARITRELLLEARFSADPAEVAQGRNDSVLLYAQVRDALERAEEALAGLDAERFREMARLFDRLYEQARRLALETRDQELLNQTFMLKHFMGELAEARDAGLLHGHDEARERLRKDIDYRRYLLEHHRERR